MKGKNEGGVKVGKTKSEIDVVEIPEKCDRCDEELEHSLDPPYCVCPVCGYEPIEADDPIKDVSENIEV